MNRKERRKQKMYGGRKNPEPTLMMKPSDLANATMGPFGKQAMMHEINQQILLMDQKYQLDIDSMMLWALRRFASWGPKKLEEFYRFMFEEHLRMREFYEMDELYPEKYKLRELGVDLEKLYKELFDERGNFKKAGDE